MTSDTSLSSKIIDGQDEQLAEVLSLCQKMNAERNLPALLGLIAREAARLMQADRATIFLLDREKCELWSQVTLDGELIRFDARLGIAGACAMTGQLINLPDAHEDQRFYSLVDARTKYRTRSVLAVPLRTATGEIIGTLQALNKTRGAFTPKDEQVAQALAAQAATALETAKMVQELRQQKDLLEAENTHLWKEVEGRVSTQNIIGTSEKIQVIVRLIDQIRDSSVDVLITGESGTGKEMVAKAIHYTSPRARRSFVAINCAALPETMVESELFGIEKGVATGVDARIGRFEQAHGGTLFLDEIGELSPAAQVKLLRVLQERVLERVGGRTPVPVDVRIIAATNADLETALKKGAFRPDLYYRLKVLTIPMPPLRDIREDIPLLANFFLEKYCREMGKEPIKPSAAVVRSLARYSWPGNTRELENEMKRLVVLTRRSTISEEDLAESVRSEGGDGTSSPIRSGRSLKEAVDELEKRMIGDALRRCQHNQLQTAKALGLSRQGLIKKMKRYGLKSS